MNLLSTARSDHWLVLNITDLLEGDHAREVCYYCLAVAVIVAVAGRVRLSVVAARLTAYL